MTKLPVHSLDARYYTDPGIFKIEQENLFAESWQFAGHASQVQKAGDYFTFRIAGENLFCIRDKDGAINAFYNVCQHRAHELLRESGHTKLIVCPYHAWTYELSGGLRSGPNLSVVPGLDRSQVCLAQVKVEEFCGFLFVNLDPMAESMDVWFPSVREELVL